MNYLILSNFDTHLFLGDYDPNNPTALATTVQELPNVLPFTPPELSKDVARYRTLDGDGWESIAPLGQSQSDMTLNFLRADVGNAYTGIVGSDNYSILRNWIDSSTALGGQASAKWIYFVRPRGTMYEGVAFSCIGSNFADGESGENGQEFSVTATPFGPQVPLNVTRNPSTMGWTFSRADATT